MISLKESLIRANKAGSNRFVFKLYKDAFPNPMISLGADATYDDYRNDVLDMDKVNRLYNKIPSGARIDSKEFHWMRNYPIHNNYWNDWIKLVNIVLYCKNTTEVKKIVENVYTKGHKTKIDRSSWNIPFHVDVDLKIQEGEKWISIDAMPEHTYLEGTNIMDISIYGDADQSRGNFPLMKLCICMYDESNRREVINRKG